VSWKDQDGKKKKSKQTLNWVLEGVIFIITNESRQLPKRGQKRILKHWQFFNGESGKQSGGPANGLKNDGALMWESNEGAKGGVLGVLDMQTD